MSNCAIDHRGIGRRCLVDERRLGLGRGFELYREGAQKAVSIVRDKLGDGW